MSTKGIERKSIKEYLAILTEGRVLSKALDAMMEETTMKDLGKGKIDHEFETIK
jgi:hypothetical protein